MSFENLGIPTVVVCTEPFMDSALLQAKSFGRSGFQPVKVPHPLGGLDSETVTRRVTAAEEQIIAALTGAQSGG